MQAVATGVVALVLAACGGGSGGGAELASGPGGGPVSTVAPVSTLPATGTGNISRPACEHLSREEVARLLGNGVTAGQEAGRSCFWGTTVDRGTSATLTVVAPAPGRAADECTTQRNSLPSEATADSVSGVGNSAVWVWQPISVLLQGNFLACWDNAVVLVFLSGERDQASLRNAASGMAQTVHARL
ncbi:MAG: hypothetical protein AB1673_05825 [Actinomycetota bacterium]|jgi:hypothetical protein